MKVCVCVWGSMQNKGKERKQGDATWFLVVVARRRLGHLSSSSFSTSFLALSVIGRLLHLSSLFLSPTWNDNRVAAVAAVPSSSVSSSSSSNSSSWQVVRSYQIIGSVKMFLTSLAGWIIVSSEVESLWCVCACVPVCLCARLVINDRYNHGCFESELAREGKKGKGKWNFKWEARKRTVLKSSQAELRNVA